MNFAPEHIAGATTHARRGSVHNAFRYGVDYVLIDPEAPSRLGLFSRNRFNLASVHDKNHGGAPKEGRGLPWAKEVFAREGLTPSRILLLTQPSFLGYVFNPVSFWLAFMGADLVAVIAEVSNTMGDRHSYVCAREGFAPIRKQDRIVAKKIFHVSPFQDVQGSYLFNYDITPTRISIRIAHENGEEGLIATLFGPRAPLTNGAVLRAALRRPTGPLRALVLIHWQAVKLYFKGARFRSRPLPPEKEVS
ncbi:DUF1365 domain-containing protein [Lentibacter sp. XHP0401]|uniref:DUF1365 domain-containing protein n=1 Tax=Lentibacter sp. XHP0401 TaxID=2984334 RepID=UPI0021E758F1|nr:DUF1365 domain-containing protein [Lentibacter sp. XHP0401]MCV2894779.1 DUF1365 domain-containing protein [Lentibacter sp. XHP0401]